MKAWSLGGWVKGMKMGNVGRWIDEERERELVAGGGGEL